MKYCRLEHDYYAAYCNCHSFYDDHGACTHMVIIRFQIIIWVYPTTFKCTLPFFTQTNHTVNVDHVYCISVNEIRSGTPAKKWRKCFRRGRSEFYAVILTSVVAKVMPSFIIRRVKDLPMLPALLNP